MKKEIVGILFTLAFMTGCGGEEKEDGGTTISNDTRVCLDAPALTPEETTEALRIAREKEITVEGSGQGISNICGDVTIVNTNPNVAVGDEAVQSFFDTLNSGRVSSVGLR